MLNCGVIRKGLYYDELREQPKTSDLPMNQIW